MATHHKPMAHAAKQPKHLSLLHAQATHLVPARRVQPAFPVRRQRVPPAARNKGHIRHCCHALWDVHIAGRGTKAAGVGCVTAGVTRSTQPRVSPSASPSNNTLDR